MDIGVDWKIWIILFVIFFFFVALAAGWVWFSRRQKQRQFIQNLMTKRHSDFKTISVYARGMASVPSYRESRMSGYGTGKYAAPRSVTGSLLRPVHENHDSSSDSDRDAVACHARESLSGWEECRKVPRHSSHSLSLEIIKEYDERLNDIENDINLNPQAE